MNPREFKIISALAVFLTAALPTTVGTIAFRAQPILQSIIIGEAGQLPGITGFYFNHFTGALVTLLVLGLGATWFAFKAYRQNTDPADSLSRLLVAVCFSSLVSILFIGLLILATTMPIYAKLTER
jgi:predicted exporter